MWMRRLLILLLLSAGFLATLHLSRAPLLSERNQALRENETKLSSCKDKPCQLQSLHLLQMDASALALAQSKARSNNCQNRLLRASEISSELSVSAQKLSLSLENNTDSSKLSLQLADLSKEQASSLAGCYISS
jgi:hypothetical protein